MSGNIKVSEKKSEAAKENRTSQTRTSDNSQPVNPSIERILFLQRTIGNQAVARLIKSGALQTKLRIGQPGDEYEQEADRVADQVMRMPDGQAEDTRIQKKCPKCLKGLTGLLGKDKKDEKLQAKETAGQTPEVTKQMEGNINALKGGGQPLPESERIFFESRFGHDFSQVQVHTDAKAAESAQAVNAKAYTVGRDVVFGAGQYVPGTSEGRRLMAHELTHTIQQEAKAPTAAQLLTSTNPEDAGERQARAAPDDVARGNAVPIVSYSGQQLARQDDDGNGGLPDAGPSEAVPTVEEQQQRICGPDITSSLTTMLGTVGPWFRGLSTFQKHRSCVALGPGGFLAGVNPGMAWDTRELFLPNTGWLDAYFRRRSCGSPRDPGCDTDPQRHLCETAGSCGNSVVVGGKCLLAGTANYALFGTMCRLCHDETSQWGRWDMRAIIGAYKTIAGDDSTPPKEVASAAYDGTFPTVPAAAENRGTCTDRCGLTHGGAFDFIWEPYKPR